MGSSSAAAPSFLMAAICAVVTAVFWGTYGPLLQRGHHFMEGGRFRPFICVGIAYLLVAVIVPFLLMPAFPAELGKGVLSGWKFSGITWSIIAGTAGALGAFGVIMAVNYGGPTSPIYVMPIIFGCAPVVNTAFSLYLNSKAMPTIPPLFFVGLMLVILGVVTVLTNAPKPVKDAPHAAVKGEKALPPAKKSSAEELNNPYSAPEGESKQADGKH